MSHKDNHHQKVIPSAEEGKMDSKERWVRGLYMVLFLIIGYVLKILIVIMSILQFISSIIYESPNKKLLTFGNSLSTYAYDIIQYLTYNTERKPYPFDSWPVNKS
jgi:hypothetical protein